MKGAFLKKSLVPTFLRHHWKPAYRSLIDRASIRAIVVAAVTFFAMPCLCVTSSPSIRLCQDSEDVYPWTLQNKPGLNIILLKIVEKKIDVNFEILSEPWQRCQQDMKAGKIDGMFAISYLNERQEFGVYPMRGTMPDVDKAMMVDGYSLYRRRNDNDVNWDGKTLSVNGAIGVQRGYSVAVLLEQLKATVDSGAYHVDDNFRKLMFGRVAAIALRTSEGDNILVTNREFMGKVEKLPIPLTEKPYFLIFSKQFFASHSKQAQEIWSTIELVRNSAEYSVVENTFR